jgi:hypothetical protein
MKTRAGIPSAKAPRSLGGFWSDHRPLVSNGRYIKQICWFALWLLVGLAACIGTILALFAWTSASL